MEILKRFTLSQHFLEKCLLHPVETTARVIENIVIFGKDADFLPIRLGCMTLSRLISVTVFPLLLTLGLVFKRIPLLLWANYHHQNITSKKTKTTKYILGILATPLSLKSPEGPSGLFLKFRPRESELRPFGVEAEYGKSGIEIQIPRNVSDLEAIVIRAREEKKQISILGSQMSQGGQTIPYKEGQIVIDMRHFKKIGSIEENDTISVEAGATWQDLQIVLDKKGKSPIVKQASDPFTIGGSIGINCHGWAHEVGSIASTVASLDVIASDGRIQTIYPSDELFGYMFGTLGYFGIIVRAKLKVVDNTILTQKTHEIASEQFCHEYETRIQGHQIPLFGGRLSLDSVNGPPFRTVCMNAFVDSREIANSSYIPEPKVGSRIHRIGLRLLAHLSKYSATRLLRSIWNKEKVKMFLSTRIARNEALHPPINAFQSLHHSNLHAQWLQEYFVTKQNLPAFLNFLGTLLHANKVRVINATIRPTPQDHISILPYAEKDRFAVVISFCQVKSKNQIAKTRKWIETVQDYLLENDGRWYQAYMPFATRDEFEKCYGVETVLRLRAKKERLDPNHLFGNIHTAKYFDVPLHQNSTFRTVFQNRALQKEFVNFLNTIFFQLDPEKVILEMEKMLIDPDISDNEIYEQLVLRIPFMKKRFASLIQLKALKILKEGIGKQAKQLLSKFDGTRVSNYTEIYDRRYVKSLQKIAKLRLNGTITAVSDTSQVTLINRIEAGSLFYPFKRHVALNESTCTNPLLEPNLTYKPLGDEIEDSSQDLIALIGGLHHIPEDRVTPFLHSLALKTRPGAPILLRDHDAASSELFAIVSVVHSFVNATAQVPLNVERSEIRDFKTAAQWQTLMEANGFVREEDEGGLVLKKDPTKNKLMLYTRAPRNLEELKEAAKYRLNAHRPKDGTKATWVEWANVRFSKAYAEFIQTNHACHFDYLGHMSQHITYFKEYLKGRSIKEAFTADNLPMNLFILISTIVQCSLSYITALPSRLYLHIKKIKVTALSSVERFQAQIEDEYSKFIDDTPFYNFPYLSKIPGLWKAAMHSNRFANFIPAVIETISLLAKAIISAPIKKFYSSATNIEPDKMTIIIYDPDNAYLAQPNCKTLYTTLDHYKLIQVPRYRPFTELCTYLCQSPNIKLIEVGGNSSITVDLLFPKDTTLSSTYSGAKKLFDLKKLQDPEKRHYVTCEVQVNRLLDLVRDLRSTTALIEYIHE